MTPGSPRKECLLGQNFILQDFGTPMSSVVISATPCSFSISFWSMGVCKSLHPAPAMMLANDLLTPGKYRLALFLSTPHRLPCTISSVCFFTACRRETFRRLPKPFASLRSQLLFLTQICFTVLFPNLTYRIHFRWFRPLILRSSGFAFHHGALLFDFCT